LGTLDWVFYIARFLWIGEFDRFEFLRTRKDFNRRTYIHLQSLALVDAWAASDPPLLVGFAASPMSENMVCFFDFSSLRPLSDFLPFMVLGHGRKGDVIGVGRGTQTDP
jgi:hypothetical protein